MCYVLIPASPDYNYLQDIRRGRLNDLMRWSRLERYAYKRWEKARDPVYYTRWTAILESIKKRKK